MHESWQSVYKELCIIISMDRGKVYLNKSILKNEVEIAVVNEPSAFEPLKFYCSCKSNGQIPRWGIMWFK